MNITVLMGGTSAERDVSLASGLRIAEALRTRGHRVVAVDTARGPLTGDDERAILTQGAVVKPVPPSQQELARVAAETLPQMLRVLPDLQRADVVFLALHGGYGEDGTVQALLDMAGVPYTGSGHLASALAMDKDLSKQIFRENDVPTANWAMVRAGDAWRRDAALTARVKALGLPVIVKPSKQGSTVGLSIVKQDREEELDAAVTMALAYDDEVMIEQFVAGRELTVGILGGEALPVGEIIPKHEIYDYECKYTAGMADERFPAALTAEQARTVQGIASRAFGALKLRGCARIDFRMADDGRFFCLEANTLPGMTGTSLIPQAAAAAGIAFPELCERIAQLAMASSSTARAGEEQG